MLDPTITKPIVDRLRIETGLMAARLLALLDSALPDAGGAIGDSRSFLQQRAVTDLAMNTAVSVRDRGVLATAAVTTGVEQSAQLAKPLQPLDRLIDGFALQEIEAQLLILAALPEEHEGFSAALRALHPRSEPWATVGLAARLLVTEEQRHLFREILIGGAATTQGILKLVGDVPLFERSLCLAEGLWPALYGIDRWPAGIDVVARKLNGPHGLSEWFEKPAAQRALTALTEHAPVTILISGESDDALLWRGLALAEQAKRNAVGIAFTTTPDVVQQQLLQIHAVLRDCVPIVSLPESDTPAPQPAIGLWSFPDAAIVCARSGNLKWRAPRPLIAVTADLLNPIDRKHMWEELLPNLSNDAAFLAARFPMEPASANHIATDLRAIERLERRPATMDDFLVSLRARAALHLSGAVKLVKPTATWDDLVVSGTRFNQLQEAVNRLQNQMQVLDNWGFLKARTGSRGVRMLFSGPPGTGKTLSAEVMANALSVDLLVVDLSRVVSKWIGETEKNLSAVFDSAERAQAVLFFDEADALFGKRTEVSDAHDRYANLETAYLLQRLERFDGLAILATNLRQNMDTAFTRRLEFAIDFEEPDREQRQRLWRTHIPDSAPLASDVNLLELASMYPVTGGLVRNAAVSAAFLAATDGTQITRQHLVRAIRREYEKAGRAFPGVPAGLSL